MCSVVIFLPVIISDVIRFYFVHDVHVSCVHNSLAHVKPGVKETSIDDVVDMPDLAQPPASGRRGGDLRSPTRSSKPVPHGGKIPW